MLHKGDPSCPRKRSGGREEPQILDAESILTATQAPVVSANKTKNWAESARLTQGHRGDKARAQAFLDSHFSTEYICAVVRSGSVSNRVE